MTCVVGFVDKKSGHVYIGGDSLGSNGYTKSVETNAKVFHNIKYPEIIMGGTTSYRHLDLLEYADTLFDEMSMLKKEDINRQYMVTKFIPQVIELFKKGVVDQDEKKCGGNFLVGVKEHLFEIQPDFSVLEPSQGFCAVGSGEQVAMGSLFTTKEYRKNLSSHEKVLAALEAAEAYCCGVQRPFKIVSTDRTFGGGSGEFEFYHEKE